MPVTASNGATSTVDVPATGNQDIDGLLGGEAWATTSLSFSFPTLGSQYGSDYWGDEPSSFQPVTAQMKVAVRAALAQFAAVSNLSFPENTATPGNATLRFGMSSDANPTAYAYMPTTLSAGGDVWFGTQTDASSMRNPVRGSYAWHSMLHEIGHALGLKHGQETGGPANKAMTAGHNSMEFSVMTYQSYVGDTGGSYGNGEWSYAQTLMMYDIAAIQKMYGADFTTNASNSTYTFSTSTGQMYINGVGQGAPGGNVIFLTIWDGGGIDTYNFSNYTSNQSISLAAGGWSLMSTTQRADLGDGHFSRGNVFNALQYGSDTRSLIENAIGGSGNDTMVGNQIGNALTGNGGNDGINGGAGADLMRGGAGSDSYTVDNAGDVVDESVSGSNGTDSVYSVISFSLSDALHAKGSIENLTLTGSAATNATGNSLANILIGNAGANTLNGLGGPDQMRGGAGNDLYVVENASDIVDESITGSNGVDTIQAAISFSLSDTAHVKGSVEKLTLIGVAAINATGNALANVLTGNAAANILNGMAGNDTLIGGLGNDVFLFNTALNASSNVDTISDFLPIADTIRLENAVFTAVGATGLLTSAAFYAGPAAHDANDRVIYNPTTGALTYDANGNSTGGSMLFAKLGTGLVLTTADFQIV